MERCALDEKLPVAIEDIASKIVDLYWQQTLPYPRSGEVLRQCWNVGQAKIVSLIQEFRVPLERVQPISASQAKTINPDGYQQLVAEVEEQLCRYVLLKLQTIGGTYEPFIYDLPRLLTPVAREAVVCSLVVCI